MKRFALPLLLTFTLILAACSTAPAAPTASPAFTTESASSPSTGETITTSELTRSDQQGQITVDITPLNLTAQGDTLEFDVVLNTHSVELSIDLAPLATLTTDTGITVPATLWDAPRGGHHVEGKLIFPALKDGKSILKGATKLTLTILEVDALSRGFEWDLK